MRNNVQRRLKISKSNATLERNVATSCVGNAKPLSARQKTGSSRRASSTEPQQAKERNFKWVTPKNFDCANLSPFMAELTG